MPGSIFRVREHLEAPDVNPQVKVIIRDAAEGRDVAHMEVDLQVFLSRPFPGSLNCRRRYVNPSYFVT